MGRYPYNLKYVEHAACSLETAFAPKVPDYYYLAFGVTSSCNYDCPFCYYHDVEMRTHIHSLPLGIAQEIFKSMPMLAGIIIGLEGEPLLYDRFLEFLELSDRHTRNIILVTNASLFTKRICEELHSFSIGNIILSIDGAETETYERFRKKGNFERFKKNASMIAEHFPCQFHATVFKQNLSSLLNLPALANSLGIRRISLQQLRPHAGSIARGIQVASFAELSSWLSDFLIRAQMFDVEIELDRNLGGSRLASEIKRMSKYEYCVKMPSHEPGHCEHADRLACILADGTLFPCAGDFEPVPLKDYSFDSIFNHPYLLALRSLHKAGRRIEPCRICMNDSPSS